MSGSKRSAVVVLLVAGFALVGPLADQRSHALGDRDDGTLGLFRGRDARVLYSVDLDERVVALTIDDGPDPATTPAILDVLRDHGARATFFVVGERIAGNEALLHRMVREGHEVANHMLRDRPSIELDPQTFEAALLQTRDALRPYPATRWFRPASGYYDDAMLDILDTHGLQCVLGNVYPLDAHIGWSWLHRTWIRWRARAGSITILHDGGRRGKRTTRTLAGVLPHLAKKGYRVVTLTELAALGGLPFEPAPHTPESR
jgi:peptidoglycan/xylan/chitin deacetylase (PgdA/CDA1 family)